LALFTLIKIWVSKHIIIILYLLSWKFSLIVISGFTYSKYISSSNALVLHQYQLVKKQSDRLMHPMRFHHKPEKIEQADITTSHFICDENIMISP